MTLGMHCGFGGGGQAHTKVEGVLNSFITPAAVEFVGLVEWDSAGRLTERSRDQTPCCTARRNYVSVSDAGHDAVCPGRRRGIIALSWEFAPDERHGARIKPFSATHLDTARIRTEFRMP